MLAFSLIDANVHEAISNSAVNAKGLAFWSHMDGLSLFCLQMGLIIHHPSTPDLLATHHAVSKSLLPHCRQREFNTLILFLSAESEQEGMEKHALGLVQKINDGLDCRITSNLL